MKQISGEFLSNIIKKALSSGGDYADVYIEHTNPLSIQLEDGKIEKLSSGVDAGIGVRVIFGEKSAYAYSNDLSQDSLINAADLVSRAVKERQGRDVAFDLRRVRPSVDFHIRLNPASVGMEKKVMLLEKADKAARGVSANIKQVSLTYRDAVKNVRIATSEGVLAEDERVQTVAIINVIAADGDNLQTGYEPLGGFAGFELFDDNIFEEIAVKSAQRAVRMLSARKAPGGRMPVVISAQAGGTMIHEAIGHGLESDLVQQGLSVYANKIGHRVASPLVTIIDDATLPNKRGSYRFDDEGTRSQRTVLVEKGILKGYMYDRLSAMKEGTALTGNGRRESYMHRPIPRMSNTFIAPGEDDPEKIVKSVSEGFFVKKMGGGQVNTVTGEFVFEVSEGYIIKNGMVDEPVRGATLIGNGIEVLKSIDMVGNDMGFSIGTCGKDAQGVPVSDAMPTVRAPEMVVGGEI
jgi:TldD protein